MTRERKTSQKTRTVVSRSRDQNATHSAQGRPSLPGDRQQSTLKSDRATQWWRLFTILFETWRRMRKG